MKLHVHKMRTKLAALAVKSKAISRPYSKPDSAYWTASAKFAYLLPAEAGAHLGNPTNHPGPCQH